MLYEAFTEPEPHFAQILKVDRIKPIEVYPKAENTNPNAVWSPDQATLTRTGNKVESRWWPFAQPLRAGQARRPRVGDEVTLHVTNVEQTTRRDPRTHRRARPEHRGGSGRDEDGALQGDEGRRLPVLLHQLLLGAALVQGLSRRRSRSGNAREKHHRSPSHERRPSCHASFPRPAAVDDLTGLVLAGIVALAAGALLPLWRIELVAPRNCRAVRLSRCAARSPPATARGSRRS